MHKLMYFKLPENFYEFFFKEIGLTNHINHFCFLGHVFIYFKRSSNNIQNIHKIYFYVCSFICMVFLCMVFS